MNEQERVERIEELLKLIGGLEISIRDALEQRDWDFSKQLKKLKPKYYEKLRRLMYGLPEERTQRPTESS